MSARSTAFGRGRILVLAALVAGVVAVSGCTAGGPSAGPSATSSAATPSAARDRGAFPVLSPEARIRLYAASRLQSMTLEQKIASMFVVHIPGSDPAPVQGYLAANGAAGVLLLGDNVPGSTQQTAAFTAALQTGDGLGTVIAIDEEGGIVARLSADTFPAAETLKNEPAAATADAFRQRAALVRQAGANVNFGVIADTTADPGSFIYDRVLGTDPATASERVAAAVTAENGQVLSTLKHFPGHGQVPGDSHDSLPSTDISMEQWSTSDEPPFQAGIDAGAPLVMFGHLVYTAVDSAPASLSPAWHALLRERLGFEGVAVTDDLLMLEASGVPAYADRTTNAVAAVAAGNDLLLYNSTVDLPPLVASIANAVRSGEIAESAVDEAVLRDLVLRRGIWLQQHPDAAL
ncbi:MAG: glycoside hydrolase family 3 protein [Herbiconiux sp.]|nr:MAG: glycoside hydrolase family 3 protein [Herbiconiux sp.]